MEERWIKYAGLKSTYLWRRVQKLTVSTNLHVHHQGLKSTHEFSQKLLKIIDEAFMNTPCNNLIIFPNNICNLIESVIDVVNRIFNEIEVNFNNKEQFWPCWYTFLITIFFLLLWSFNYKNNN